MYIDGFVTAVPAANKDAYLAHATGALSIFKELGVLRMVEGWGDDVPDGKRTDFRRAVQAGPDEAVLFSWLDGRPRPSVMRGWRRSSRIRGCWRWKCPSTAPA